eukprot:6174116-Pleurochrysis_carterae.AAC.4
MALMQLAFIPRIGLRLLILLAVPEKILIPRESTRHKIQKACDKHIALLLPAAQSQTNDCCLYSRTLVREYGQSPRNTAHWRHACIRGPDPHGLESVQLEGHASSFQKRSCHWL